MDTVLTAADSFCRIHSVGMYPVTPLGRNTDSHVNTETFNKAEVQLSAFVKMI